MKKYIKPDFIYVIAILMFMAMFVNLNYVPNYRKMRDVIFVIVGIYLVFQIPRIDFIKDNWKLWACILLTSAVTIYTSYVQRYDYADFNILSSAIEFSISVIETFLLLGIIGSRGLIDKILKYYEVLLVLVIAANDALAFAIGPRDKIYFLGSKFVVVYIHLLFLAIYLYNRRKNRLKLLEVSLFSVFMVVISLKVSCATGIVGTAAFFIFYLFLSRYKVLYENPKVYTVVLLLCGSFVITYSLLLNSGVVQKIVTELLGRSLTLTGRVDIYIWVPFILLQKLWFGYGYASTYEVYMFFTGYANSQNGLIDWISQIGIVGTAGLVGIFIYSIAYNYKTEENRDRVYPLILFIYVLTFISTIEISYNKIFISVMALIWASALEKRRINEKA
ncbi:hypothetical protein SAMN02910298_02356 [Pseudobutyrivibrio sp. YE44]|uniref:O-antigen ligase family protein n=1 Tax=Pseudobutyrivibrio sp. YE44 TaxID=1520802 RepID=UPI00087EA388|nr:hypothetical protein [Pseudobutyrivibrio sp. YE44]SDB46900.1 hypothetical protein SAMN02910298_02356 [Pseudobutyrivibrio sp. YE44]